MENRKNFPQTNYSTNHPPIANLPFLRDSPSRRSFGFIIMLNGHANIILWPTFRGLIHPSVRIPVQCRPGNQLPPSLPFTSCVQLICTVLGLVGSPRYEDSECNNNFETHYLVRFNAHNLSAIVFCFTFPSHLIPESFAGSYYDGKHIIIADLSPLLPLRNYICSQPISSSPAHSYRQSQLMIMAVK